MNTCIRCNITKHLKGFRYKNNTCLDCEKRYAKSVYMLDGIKKEDLDILRQQYFDFGYIKINLIKYTDKDGNYYWSVNRFDGVKYKMFIPLYSNFLSTINDIYNILIKLNPKAIDDVLYIKKMFKTDYYNAVAENAKL